MSQPATAQAVEFREDPGPHSAGAEATVLGLMLDRHEAAAKGISQLKPAAFVDARNRAVFDALSRVATRGEDTDVVTVSDELRSNGELERAGGMGYLAELLDAAGPRERFDSAVRRLQETALQRVLLGVSREIETDARTAGPGQALGLLESAQRKIHDLADAYAGVVETEGQGLVTLREILKDPKELRPPKPVVDRFAWAGRTVLFAGREKSGKSTRTSHAVAEASRKGPVLLYALEEHQGDVARRLQEFGADPDQVYLRGRVGADPIAQLTSDVRQVEPVLVVIDTLYAFCDGMGLEGGEATDWAPVMNGLAHVARDSGAAVVIVHHGRKSDGKYRDSTAIGAGVDMILEMQEGNEPNSREVSARGRWPIRDYTMVLVETKGGPRFEFDDGSASLDVRVYRYIERNPGCSTRDVREAVQGKTLAVTQALKTLEGAHVENRASGGRHAWHPLSRPGSPS